MLCAVHLVYICFSNSSLPIFLISIPWDGDKVSFSAAIRSARPAVLVFDLDGVDGTYRRLGSAFILWRSGIGLRYSHSIPSSQQRVRAQWKGDEIFYLLIKEPFWLGKGKSRLSFGAEGGEPEKKRRPTDILDGVRNVLPVYFSKPLFFFPFPQPPFIHSCTQYLHSLKGRRLSL